MIREIVIVCYVWDVKFKWVIYIIIIMLFLIRDWNGGRLNFKIWIRIIVSRFGEGVSLNIKLY